MDVIRGTPAKNARLAGTRENGEGLDEATLGRR